MTAQASDDAKLREALEPLRDDKGCEYCRLGWPMMPSIAMPGERHIYPKDYKGMRAGMGPGCQAHRIREILEGSK